MGVMTYMSIVAISLFLLCAFTIVDYSAILPKWLLEFNRKKEGIDPEIKKIGEKIKKETLSDDDFKHINYLKSFLNSRELKYLDACKRARLISQILKKD